MYKMRTLEPTQNRIWSNVQTVTVPVNTINLPQHTCSNAAYILPLQCSGPLGVVSAVRLVDHDKLIGVR